MMREMDKDNFKGNVINYSAKDSTYLLGRWLTEGRKEGPWNLLRPYSNICWDISARNPRISGTNDVDNWSMIIEIRDDNLLKDDIILDLNGSDLSA